MTIRERLEAGHSKAITTAVVKFVGNDATRFKELVQLVLTGDDELAPWAAWPMSYVVETYPELLKPWIPKLIQKLSEKNRHPGIKRNILRAFEFVDIPEKYEGRAVDIFFSEIADPANPPAIIAFAITAAARICGKYPELMTEFELVLSPLQQHPQPPSITVRLKQIRQPKTLKQKRAR